MPELEVKLQMYTKGFEMDLMTLLIMFMLIPSYPLDFFGLHSRKILAISYIIHLCQIKTWNL